MHDHIACKLPNIVLLFRLEAMREITLSGFQLELYTPAERPHAYWYAAKVIEAHLECYDELLPFLPADSRPYHEMEYRHRLLLALGATCSALFLLTRTLVPLEWEETQHAFYRRWKWAYRPDYERIRATPVAHPDLYEFIQSMDVRFMVITCVGGYTDFSVQRTKQFPPRTRSHLRRVSSTNFFNPI